MVPQAEDHWDIPIARPRFCDGAAAPDTCIRPRAPQWPGPRSLDKTKICSIIERLFSFTTIFAKEVRMSTLRYHPIKSDCRKSIQDGRLSDESKHPGPARAGELDSTERAACGARSHRELGSAPGSGRQTHRSDADVEIGLARGHLARLLASQDASSAHGLKSREHAITQCLGLIVLLLDSAARKRRDDPELATLVSRLRQVRLAYPRTD